jgi:moderate conductance mechanosensitive channel
MLSPKSFGPPTRTSTIASFAGELLVALSILLFNLVFLVSLESGAFAAETNTIGSVPPQVKTFQELLVDPVVVDWMRKQVSANPSTPETKPPESKMTMISSEIEARVSSARDRLRAIAAGVPNLSNELIQIFQKVREEVTPRAPGVIPLMLVFLLLGIGAQWLVRQLTRRIQVNLDEQDVPNRLRTVRVRAFFDFVELLAFAAGSIGAFVVFTWPPLIRHVVIGYLVAFLGYKLCITLVRILLRPRTHSNEVLTALRIVPVDDFQAQFWLVRAKIFLAWTIFGRITIELLVQLGLSPDAQLFLTTVHSTGLLLLALEGVWNRPKVSQRSAASRVMGGQIFITVFLILLWLFWLADLRVLFLLGLVLIALPPAIALSDRSVGHLLRAVSPGSEEASRHAVLAVIVQRGLRAAILIGAAYLLNSNVKAALSGDAFARIVEIAFNAIVAYALFDFFWQLIRTVIDRKIANFRIPGTPADELAIRRQRLSTILPFVRNGLLAVLIVIVALMYLASLGIPITPLLAGASVVGVAIGFGSQTVVKDVLSGVFYLIDDAFRVGEYIQSGSYMGTVEGFTLRSVRLRHHRGPVFTVPFGNLGAVQNMSRDWSLEKIVLGVTYDTDLVKLKKIIKQVGKELEDDPEYAPHVIETLKMQGVDEFGDFAIKVKLKLMVVPGEGATIRRWVLTRLKTLFDENGIEFAFPTVKVAEGQVAAAVASAGLKVVPPSKL